MRQIGIVIDLAIEHHDNGSIFIEHRLLTAAQIDDAQAAMPQADIFFNEISLVVRPAVGLNIVHPLNQMAINRFTCAEIDDPADPAHRLFPRLRRVQ